MKGGHSDRQVDIAKCRDGSTEGRESSHGRRSKAKSTHFQRKRKLLPLLVGKSWEMESVTKGTTKFSLNKGADRVCFERSA